ncbi:MAG: hypothetical protein LBD20_00065 [Spirochaetaceae bacterium]|nr:hypothetical protein [Spirochaetaceae bacterium]
MNTENTSLPILPVIRKNTGKKIKIILVCLLFVPLVLTGQSGGSPDTETSQPAAEAAQQPPPAAAGEAAGGTPPPGTEAAQQPPPAAAGEAAGGTPPPGTEAAQQPPPAAAGEAAGGTPPPGTEAAQQPPQAAAGEAAGGRPASGPMRAPATTPPSTAPVAPTPPGRRQGTLSPPEEAPPPVPKWAGVISEDLRRPRREDAPLYPRDALIGELGMGDADNNTYRYARNVLYDLVMQNKTSVYIKELDAKLLTEVFEKISKVSPRKYRVGSGFVEPDGAVSFLYRFLGREMEVTGSIYFLKTEGDKIVLDGLIMDDVTETNSIKNSWDYTYLPYERFY